MSELHRAMGADVQYSPNGAPQRQIAKRIHPAAQFYWARPLGVFFSDFDVVHAHWPFPAGLLNGREHRSPQTLVVIAPGAMIDDFEQRPWLIQRLVLAIPQSCDGSDRGRQTTSQQVRQVTQLPSGHAAAIPMGVWHSGTLLDPRKCTAPPIVAGSKSELLSLLAIWSRLRCRYLTRSHLQCPSRSSEIFSSISAAKVSSDLRWNNGRHGHLADGIHFLGAIPSQEVSTWLAATDLCVVPSRSEAYGLVTGSNGQSGRGVGQCSRQVTGKY
ncbi:MAG: hypothetical protein R2932_47730 [Caldilineaceae bacterium]